MAKRRSSTTAENNGLEASFKSEVILWAVLAVSIILFISNFGIAGKVGNWISSVIFGLFGLTAYLFPILLFAGTAFIIANKENAVAVIKAAAAVGFFVFVCMFMELIGGNSDAKTPLDSYLWAAEHKYGGGLTGGLLAWLIRPNLGLVSAYVIDIVMLIICMVLITQRSLWKHIQSGGRKVYTSARNETIRQHQQYTERRQRRMDNKVMGVSTDTSIKEAKAGISDNVSEIRPDPAFVQEFPIHMMGQKTEAEKNWNQEAGQSRESFQNDQSAQKEDILLHQAAGMDYAGVMPFPVTVNTEPAPAAEYGRDLFDNIIPIQNQKVVLRPNAPMENSVPKESPATKESFVSKESFVPKESPATKESFARKDSLASEEISASEENFVSEEISASGENFVSEENPVLQQTSVLDEAPEQEAENDILANTNDIFSGLFSEAADALSGRRTDGQFQDHQAENNGIAALEASASGTGLLLPDTDTKAGAAELSSPAADTLSVYNLDQQPDEEEDADFHYPPATAEELMDAQLRAVNAGPAGTSALAAAPKPAQNPQVPKTVSRTPANHPKQSQAEIAGSVTDIGVQLQQAQPAVKREYILPPVNLLKHGNPNQTGDSRQHLQETALKLQQTLKNFGVNVTILNVSCGPSVTRYEIQPEMGVKVSKIVNLADDIKLNLAAADIRIEAPIPGKAAIGIEVPNKENVPVMFRDLIEAEEFQKHTSPCAFAAGKDIAGQVVVTDICKMPHLLIAGATGSGKSVCINTIIMSIIYKANPDDVKLIMIDPKVVELSVYNGIPHLLLPVVTDPKKAAGALHWAVSEMMDRYQKFADYGVRDMKGYNAKIKKIADIADESKPQKMPYIVIIVDELADLMMAAPGDVEDAICRLAQLARAAGIHLIIATQRPSVNVITGLIKANMPSRIAFSVTSGIDSRTILDMNGAEKLLGKGDMLFYPQGYQKPVRVQGAFVSDSEVSEVVEFLTKQNGTSQYSSEIEKQVTNAAAGSGAASLDAAAGDERDVYFADAAKLLIDKEKASVSMLQRYFKIGFNRAARIMDQLEEAGVVGPEEGTKPRKILMSPEEFAQYEEEVL